MIDQVYDAKPVPIESALEELLPRISGPLAQDRIAWFIGGSTAAWLLGADVHPRDIDLGTTRIGVDRVAEVLAEYLIEPIAPTDWPGDRIVRGARAFIGTFQEGARIEWSVPIEPHLPVPYDEWGGQIEAVRLLDVPFRERRVRVSRPEYALVRAWEKQRLTVADAIASVVRRIGPDISLLDALLARSRLSVGDQQGLRRSILSE
jgi:hypothetical protein